MAAFKCRRDLVWALPTTGTLSAKMRLRPEYMTNSNTHLKKLATWALALWVMVRPKIFFKRIPLTVLGHKNRAPVDDLLQRGAQEAQTPADLASRSNIVFMCLPSSGHVEEAVFGESGILSVAQPGFVLVDSTTSEPDSTRRIGAALRARGADMVDALWQNSERS